MCKYNNLKSINVIRRANPFVADGWHEVFVDACIAEELQELNNAGVITLNSCCGHGKSEFADCLVDDGSAEKVKSLGYEIREYDKEHSRAGILPMNLRTKPASIESEH